MSTDENTSRRTDEESPDDLAGVWALTAPPPPPPGGWQQFKAYLNRSTGSEEAVAAPPRRGRGFSLLLKVAALLAIGVGMGLLWPYVADLSRAPLVATITAPARANTLVELPGGVTVRLNAVSTLSYIESHGGVEEVELEGEAYFEVPHGREQPFLVRTEAGLVRDLGTRFNVEARDQVVSVVVTEGEVELESAGHGVRILAGQMSSAEQYHPPTAPREVNVEAAVAWTEGRLVLRDEPLRLVAEGLERRYGIRFDVAPELGSERITASFGPHTDAVSAASAICEAVGARCDRTTDGWSIRSR